MTTIFAASSGSYSDYRVEALFSTKRKAAAHLAAFPHEDWNGIEEYELDPPTADLMARGYQPWRVHMLRDGTVERVWRDDGRYASSYDESAVVWKRTKAPAYKGRDVPDALVVCALAKNERAAVKIANERRAEMIASGKWP